MTVLRLQRAKGYPKASAFCLATVETPEKEDEHINIIDALQVWYKFSMKQTNELKYITYLLCIISISTISLQYWYCLYCSNNRKMSLQVSIGSSTASWPINFQNSQGFSGKILSYSIQRKIISIFISKVLWKTIISDYIAVNTRFLRFYI